MLLTVREEPRPSLQLIFPLLHSYIGNLPMVENWHRLSREAMESPSLEMFKCCLVVILGNLLSR